MIEDVIAGLRRLADDDPAALPEAVASCRWFERALIAVLPALQANPDVAAALRERLPDYRRGELDLWLGRTLLELAGRHDVDGFCALATARARRHDPSFPALDPAGLVVTDSWFCGGERGLDSRVDGRGWTLSVMAEDVGPAECIHQERWRATAHGLDRPLMIARDQVHTQVELWEEPREG